MSEAKFSDFKLKLVTLSFDSALTDLIIELNYLRKKPLRGSTHPNVFFQLKHILHTLESIRSARIEGNNTTVAEYIETKLEANESVSERIREIKNIEKAMEFVEDNIKDYPINRMFLSELHKMIVNDLLPPPQGEGDHTSGLYENINLKIINSNHLPTGFYKSSGLYD